jgi:[histone H3]-lysine36 N-dimethyltransferase SETMAR
MLFMQRDYYCLLLSKKNFYSNLLTMSYTEEHIRHLMLYEFRKGNNASVATRNINEVYANALKERKCQEWFVKFRSGDTSLANRPRGAPPTKVCNSVLEELVESDPRQTLHDMAAIMECSHEAIRQHLLINLFSFVNYNQFSSH